MTPLTDPATPPTVSVTPLTGPAEAAPCTTTSPCLQILIRGAFLLVLLGVLVLLGLIVLGLLVVLLAMTRLLSARYSPRGEPFHLSISVIPPAGIRYTTQ